jgi:hypothetical protein
VSSVLLEASPAARPSPPQPAPGAGGTGHGGQRPHLRLVSAPTSRASTWRRRTAAVLTMLAVVFLLAVAVGRIGASADLQDRVAGHVVIEPGETLWDVAVATAPDGTDPRAQLRAIQELNGIGGGDVDAWTVVLLPAR